MAPMSCFKSTLYLKPHDAGVCSQGSRLDALGRAAVPFSGRCTLPLCMRSKFSTGTPATCVRGEAC
eukprot:CAMPEP_0172037846 /NCGR_PEP_ID=MMETSP1041-20130122/22980_1 /TAXON_ID=464988 /ORGANISM="Hemiselmis andersenii, Strain CCMP439" /LENGTH=65 /DNA_ID=CAMNT_0012695299 /DNA_START=105 /DNA_END=299 /DNA_ORIENTATION=-